MVGLKQGSTLKSGKYKIVKTLGQGSFGITYLATTRISMDGQLGKMDVNVNVTIKEFFMSDLNSRATDGTSVERTNSTLVKNYLNKFQREAANLSKLHHPNIVKVLEVFDENNTTYYVMEFIDGETIDEYIKRNGKLSVEESLKITKEVCAALSYMHDHKMLHLDLKPKNIMRDSEGHIYLIDFGLAKQYNENGEPESSTTLGLGTLGYAPIEQARYKQDGTFPVTLDIYAVGASLYKMLTGKTPPESSYVLNDGLPLDALKQVGVDDNVIAIVEKAMAPIKKDRYQSIDSMSNAIENITSDGEQTSYPDEAERTVYEEDVEVMSEDAHADSPINKNVITDNNEEFLNSKIGKKRIGIIVGLGFLVLLLLCTISNIPLEIRNIVGYRTDDAEDFLIKNWNTGILGLCLGIACLIYYVFTKKKFAVYISIAIAVLSLGFLMFFINSERESVISDPTPSVTEPTTEASTHIKKEGIDLGLPSGTLWASCNIGATSENEDGDHYAFGTLESLNDYPHSTGDNFKDGESVIGTQYDVATARWGEEWQLPSKEQISELIIMCRFTIRAHGYEVVGPNGNKLLLPYTHGNDQKGYYWSGNKGYVLEFQPGYKEKNQDDDAELVENFATYCGLSIRAVKKIKN